MIFHKHKTIFIHNPKCGGTTIHTVLGGQGDVPLLAWHCPWNVHKNNLPDDVIRTYFKFSFVRNPWDRLLSAYRWYRRGGSRNKRDMDIKQSLPKEFEVFVKKLQNYQTCRISAVNPPFLKVPHFMPQTFMLGDVEYDFIGRFETFTSDVKTVFKMIGLNKKSLPHKHNGGKVDYREHYTKETRDIVAKHFKDDIVKFNYSF